MAKAIGQAQTPLNSRVGLVRAVPRRVQRMPVAAPVSEPAAPSPKSASPTVSEAVGERIPAGPLPEASQPVPPLPQVHVQRIVTPVQSPAALPQPVLPRVEIREKRLVEELEIVREVARGSDPPAGRVVSETLAPAAEEPVPEVMPEPQPAVPVRMNYEQIPVQVELPRGEAQLPSETRREVERTVTRVVRERVRNAALPRTASAPEKVEVRIDHLTVRVENPPAPQQAPAAAPAPGGFADYILARTVSR